MHFSAPSVASVSSVLKPNRHRRRARCRGLSMIEMVVSMAISLMLLTATTGAMVASFKAYGDAVEQASTQVAVRMVTQRLLALVRTSTAHGPLDAGGGATINGDTITSPFIELIDPNGDIVRCEYRQDDQELWLIRDPGGGNELAQPLLAGVTAATFSLRRPDVVIGKRAGPGGAGDCFDDAAEVGMTIA